jgi:hypothetical protein
MRRFDTLFLNLCFVMRGPTSVGRMEDESVMILLCCLETPAILFFPILMAGECWVWDLPHV